jgi:hypothetical protein
VSQYKFSAGFSRACGKDNNNMVNAYTRGVSRYKLLFCVLRREVIYDRDCTLLPGITISCPVLVAEKQIQPVVRWH